MRFTLYIGLLLGFTLAFFIVSIWKNEFVWSWWFSTMIGSSIGCLIMRFIIKQMSKNK
ncbi:hypothetical protein [Virgibacillus senegalensis]|uniref:hypothetical protein n=1 Tax=Virgibacillus senegalensis TaxID=1499679 RepID=UPI000B052D27|nr:hypothetical protein [Virgibacillus senegalensis]